MYIISFFCLTCVLFIAYLLIGIINYNSQNKKKYSLLNHFPFELNKENKFPIATCLYAIYIAFLIIFHFTYFIIRPKELFIDNFNYIFLVFLFLNDVLSFMMVQSPIKESFKTHISFMVFYFMTTLLNNIYALFYLIRFNYSSQYFMIYYCIIIILIIILIIITMLSTFKNNEDGTRKRFFKIAFFEWLFLFINISFNLILTSMYFIN